MSRDLEALVRRANVLSRDEQLEKMFGDDLSHRLLGRIRDLEEGRMTDMTTDEHYDGGEPLVEMKTNGDRGLTRAPTSSARGGPRRLAPAALVAALALLVGVPVGLFFTDSRPSPVEIAESYIEARKASDADRARELVADDFRTTEPPDGFVDAEGMELAFQQHEAYGFHYGDVDCDVTDEAGGVTWVECGYLWTTELHRIANQPATPESMRFVIEDDLIQAVARGQRNFSEWWDSWLDFLGSEHPEFRNVVVRALRNEPESTRELVEGLPEHLNLYREWVESEEG